MTFLRNLGFLILPLILFCSSTAEVNVQFTAPTASGSSSSGSSSSSSLSQGIDYADVDISSYFTSNHQAYPLTPNEEKVNQNQQPIFSSNDAFIVLEQGKIPFGHIPRGKLLSLEITMPKSAPSSEMTVSFTEKQLNDFALISLKHNEKSIPIKVYLIDKSKPAQFQKVIEVKAGEKYSLERVSGKSLFIIIPKKAWITADTVDINQYTLPMEVHYHTP